MAGDPEPSTVGNLSIGNDLTVESTFTVTEGLAEGDFNKLSLPGFNGPFPPENLYWGLDGLLWAGILQW